MQMGKKRNKDRNKKLFKKRYVSMVDHIKQFLGDGHYIDNRDLKYYFISPDTEIVSYYWGA